MHKLRLSHAAMGRLIFGLALIAIALYVNWSQLPSIRAEEGNRAGLVIQHSDGEPIKQCIIFTEETISGYNLLDASGLDLNIEVDGAGDTTICRIDNQGCTFPQDQCFCECTSVPCTYWNYWKLEDGDWVHSTLGASNRELRDGDVDAWSWSTVADQRDEPVSKPPVITFDEICNPELVATQTAAVAEIETATAQAATAAAATLTAAAPTATPMPTATHTPTQTPTPTATSIPPPVILTLNSDRQQITAGEGVVISWETSGAESVVLRKPDDSELGLGASGAMTLNPGETSSYSVIARNSGGEDKVNLTITVLPADAQNSQPTATASGGDSPPETPTATVTAPVGESPPRTPTPTAAQTQNGAAATTPTVIVISAPPATLTPAQQATAAVIVVDAPPSTSTPTPIESAAQSAADLIVDTPIPTPTATAAPPTAPPPPTDTPTVVISSNEIPDATEPETTAVTEADVIAADEPQLANIFAGMIFIMAVPLLLGLAWMGFRAMGSRRQ